MIVTRNYCENARLLDECGNQSVLFQNLSSYKKGNVMAKFDKHLSASFFFHASQNMTDSKRL